jgi:hypothetical protein
LTNEVSNKQAEGMKIRIKIGEKVVTATLTDNETARDLDGDMEAFNAPGSLKATIELVK